MAYTVHQAKTHLSRLLKEAEAGQEVVVMRGNKPVAKIVPFDAAAPEPLPFRLMGAYRGRIHWDEDAFDPMTEEELREAGMDYLAAAPLLSSSSEPSVQ
jgi:prevent-host-death family protein